MMGNTTLDLYRGGKKPKLHRLRLTGIDPEIVIHARKGDDWVDARSGGASTLDAPLLRGNRPWWRLPKGTIYDDKVLTVENDYGNHYSWMPAVDMPLKDFVAALEAVNGQFIRV